ncbi:nucleotidyltransferase [Hyalangium rubrum]|uniref:Cyclic GMP-AMP synthase n=1 Tax=Hyalangium rubrum TaxID=3103134 RepID=A0ABU5HAA8_9BACT|nr:nucleotidyltransferase [Hyalangium sp. s54d21]MDY7230250.1 nucleotidyltransferase [Hyalangium sp. s54d21]
MSLQPLFRRFHETIQLKQYEENAELRQKRDIILERLRDKLRPRTFEPFNQGSYAMGTGIKPIDRDYDIDIGIVFDLDHLKNDPVTVKGWVYEAVVGHTTSVEWRRPCITVNYQQGREPKYHVDLAVMARDSRGTLRLALGKQHSQADQREWQVDDRQGFIEAVKNRFNGEDGFQFRRVIRYLKRWKDEHFSNEGRAAPSGLSLTVAAYRWFAPKKSSTYQGVEYDDLAATTALVGAMRQNFQTTWDLTLGRSIHRLSLQFTHAPHDDVLARMTNQQMEEFYGRIEKLSGWLEDARKRQSAEPLQRAFGSDFPVS